MFRLSCYALVFALVLCAAPSHAEDHYIDLRGERVAFQPTYDAWFGRGRYPVRVERAVGENLALLGLEFFIYWYEPSLNTVDWQFPNIGDKFTSNETVRLDDNMQFTNSVMHSFAGSMHYGFSRVNGLSVPASFAAAAMSSALYETVLEFREIISVNDLIVTPFGGMALGEFFHQIGNYVNSEPVRPRTLDDLGVAAGARKLSSLTFGLVRRSHDIVDNPSPPPYVPADNLGFSSAYAHRFALYAGGDIVENDRGASDAVFGGRLEASVAAMPGFLRPGRIDTAFGNGNFTSLDLRIAGNDSGMQDADLAVDSHLFGRFVQRLDVGADGLRGEAVEVAGYTGLRVVERWLLGRRDHFAMIHLLAPITRAWVERGPLRLAVAADVSPDLAEIRSLAFEKWQAELGPEGVRSSLRLHGYNHAWGVSGGVRTALSYRAAAVGFAARYGRYESIDGIDRKQEEATRDTHASEDVLELSTSLVVEPGSLVSARLDAARTYRRSEMAPFTHSRHDERIGMSLGIRF